MNGLTGTRRVASPVRLTLAKQVGADIDGAWWPHTDSVANELPELVGVLHRRLGEIVDIRINWSAAEGQLDLNTIVTGNKWTVGAKARRPRLMSVAGRDTCVKLLVVPCKTSQVLGGLVMRCAAAMPVDELARQTPFFETADCVLRVAQAESARWLGRMQNPAGTLA
ncbi:DUF5994 family protein [Mycolicibacterium wolinskyi]|uniref:DUF5994 family protein n=1 Tax=Mycolicibacterium wolinskyi TaxID=59750 RepID=UPI0039179E7E